MNDQEINSLRFQVYDKLCKSESKKEKKYNQKLLNIIDYTIQLKDSMKKISKIGVSHIWIKKIRLY